MFTCGAGYEEPYHSFSFNIIVRMATVARHTSKNHSLHKEDNVRKVLVIVKSDITYLDILRLLF